MERLQNVGAVIALLALVLCIVFAALGQMDFRTAGLIGLVALSRLV